MTEITHRQLETNGISMHIAEAGQGPLVILCHGFPESWYSWRHQLVALAEAGFHAVAPDMRGYGRTDAPQEIQAYTLLHMTGDMIGLVQALGAEKAVIAGHDWGGPVAWHAALFRPDIFRGVIGLSVPFTPRLKNRPTSMMPQDEAGQFYQLYFQTPGVAESELARDARNSLRRIIFSGSGDIDAAVGDHIGMVPRGGGFLSNTVDPDALPSWITEADIDAYAGDFARTGFRGGLNWYRNIDRNWELLAPFAGAKVTVPALYMAGDRDLVVKFRGFDRLIGNLEFFVPNLRDVVLLPGCGHWTQQERASEVNKAMIGFLESLV
jgi:pimeloyl-ACP methyl ester carboxylesterase